MRMQDAADAVRRAPDAERRHSDAPIGIRTAIASSGDASLYAVTALLMIIVGAVVRTWLLNWVIGPLFVVCSVTALGELRDRHRRKAARS
jgi:hypothetical protein